MPRERPQPPPFEPESLERSLDRYLFVGPRLHAPARRGLRRVPGARAAAAQGGRESSRPLVSQHRPASCSPRAAPNATAKDGDGGSAPTLNAKQFLKSATDEQIRSLIAGGVSGTDMPAWSQDYGGTLTDEQVRQIVTYLRSFEPHAPSVPDWRQGKSATP